jgi:hypothetical protein
VQAVLQHTPSTQLAAPLTQSALLLHMAPWACLVPHTCVTVLQVTPAQSLSVSQVVRHWVAFRHLYTPPPQACGVETKHVPALLPAPQKDWLVNMPPPLEAVFAHDWLWQLFELSQSWQRRVPALELSPVHLPFVPQVLGTVVMHISDGSAWPAATAVQVPAAPPGGLQVSQTPSHAWSQQTLSWLQVSPLPHWLVVEQVPPFWIRPHEPFTQVFGFVQSALVVHELTHIKAVASQRPGAHP